jgi:hypothetical protein
VFPGGPTVEERFAVDLLRVGGSTKSNIARSEVEAVRIDKARRYRHLCNRQQLLCVLHFALTFTTCVCLSTGRICGNEERRQRSQSADPPVFGARCRAESEGAWVATVVLSRFIRDGRTTMCNYRPSCLLFESTSRSVVPCIHLLASSFWSSSTFAGRFAGLPVEMLIVLLTVQVCDCQPIIPNATSRYNFKHPRRM